MPGFNSPSILFLSTWDAPERNYLASLWKKLRARGYTRYVELCAGAFAMPLVAIEQGWPKEAIVASDVHLFTALLGSTFTGAPLEALDLQIDGAPLVLPAGSRARQAATVLYEQLLLRMEKRPELPYWDELRHDIDTRRTDHITEIEGHIKKLDAKLHGIGFAPRDPFAHLAEVWDDPHTVVAINPPTYAGAYEKFYDTGGRLTWAQPEYQVFDADVDIFRLCDLMQGKAALLLCQQQQVPGNAAHDPVYARHLSFGQFVYLCTNRPAEVLALAGGLKVVPLREKDLCRIDRPVLPPAHVFTPASTIEVMAVSHKEACYYRDLWMHKMEMRQAHAYVAVVIDGFLAGMIGYDTTPIYHPYPGLAIDDDVRGALLLKFAVGAPHAQRLTRLITMIALSHVTIGQALQPHTAVLVDWIITVEMTRHPEAKGLRGLMTLRTRIADPKWGNRLIYFCHATRDTFAQIPGQWLAQEQRWQAARAKTKQEATV